MEQAVGETDVGRRRRGHKIMGGICSLSVAPRGCPGRAGGMWSWLWGACSPLKSALQSPWGLHSPITPSCPSLDAGELGQHRCCYLHQEHQDAPLLLPPHSTAGSGCKETFISLHQFPCMADTRDCYRNLRTWNRGTLPGWEAPVAPRKGCHRRRVMW